MSGKITLTLTGNFQYDAGILGLINVLDFFNAYKAVNRDHIELSQYSLSIDKDKWPLVGHLGYIYGFIHNNKFIDKYTAKVKDHENRMDKSEKIKEILLKAGTDSLDSESEKYHSIFLSSIEEIQQQLELNKDNVKTPIAAFPLFNLMNITHLNSFNPSPLTKEIKNKKGDTALLHPYEKFIKIFAKTIIPEKQVKGICTFCGRHADKTIGRETFLLGASALNYSWFEEPNIFICPICIGINRFVFFSLFPVDSQFGFIYTSNLKIARDDYIAVSSVLDKTTQRIPFQESIEHMANQFKTETAIKNEKLFILFTFDSKSPAVETLRFTIDILHFLADDKVKNMLSMLSKNDFSWTVKGQTLIRAYRSTISAIINNDDLLGIADFILLGRIKSFTNDKLFNAFKDNKSAKAASLILDISSRWKRRERMNKIADLSVFEKHGESLGRSVTAGKGRTDKTAMNKRIQIASAVRDAAHESRERLFEVLTELAIHTAALVPQEIVNPIVSGEITHTEAGLAISLGIMTDREKLS